MKPVASLYRSVLSAGFLGIAAAVALLPGSALAQVKGATQLLPLKKLQTVTDLQTVEAGDKIIMSCPKCKNTYEAVVESRSRG
jgi:hypothetical protein